jgi:hypothetical protein
MNNYEHQEESQSLTELIMQCNTYDENDNNKKNDLFTTIDNIFDDKHRMIHKKNATTQIIKMIDFVTTVASNSRDEFELMKIVLIDGLILKYVNHQTENICMMAVKTNGLALKYVKNKNYDIQQYYQGNTDARKTSSMFFVCMEAVKQNGIAIKFVNDEYQDHELCINAIKNTALSLKYVTNQTVDICMFAIEIFDGSIHFVKNVTIDICIMCIKIWKNMDLIKNVFDVNEELLLFAYDYDPIGVIAHHLCPDYLVNDYFCNENQDPRKTFERVAQKCGLNNLSIIMNKLSIHTLMYIIPKHGMFLGYLPYELRTYNICFEAINKSPEAIIWVPSEHIDDNMINQ